AGRLALTIGIYRPQVLPPRDPVIPGAALAEPGLQLLERPGLEVGAGVNAEPVHLRGRRGPDAVELRHRQGLDERLPLLRHDGELAVRLALARGQLGEELVVGDAC